MTKINEYKAGLSLIKKVQELQSEYPPLTPLGKFFGRSPLAPEAVSWYKGIRGEIAIGKLLEPLKTLGYTILHSVPIGEKGSDIDHIVISPSGKIFTLNTKRHIDAVIKVLNRAVIVNGQNYHYYKNSIFEKDRVEEKLNKHTGFQTSVYPVLVYVGAKALNIEQESDVTSVKDTNLIAYIKETEKSLPTSTFDLTPLNDVSFWINSDVEEINQDELFTWYNNLHKRVQRAHSRNALIKLLFLGIVIVGIGLSALRYLDGSGILG